MDNRDKKVLLGLILYRLDLIYDKASFIVHIFFFIKYEQTKAADLETPAWQ